MAITKKQIKERIQTVLNFGLQYNDAIKSYQYLDSDILVTEFMIEDKNPDEWTATLNDITAAIERLKDVPASVGELVEFAEVVEFHVPFTLTKEEKEAAEIKHTQNIALLNKLKEASLKLSINSLEDKEVYKVIATNRSKARKMRTGTEAYREEQVAAAVEYQRFFNSHSKEYKVLLLEIETHYQAQLDKWDMLKNAEALKKKEAEEKFLKDRVISLIDSGVKFNGEYYAIGDNITLTIDAIKNYSETGFSGLLEAVKKAKALIDAEEERLRQEEETRKENERKEREQFEQEQRKLAEEKKKLQDELAAMRKEKLQMRHDKLLAIGLLYIKTLAEYQYGNICLPFEKMEAMGNDEFNEYVNTTSEIIAEFKDTEKREAEEIAKLEEQQRKDAEIQAAKLLDEKTKREEKEALEYSIKSNDLINLGMKIIPTNKGQSFIRENEFNNSVWIDVFEVKVTDMDMWPAKLLTITDAITALNEATETRRREIAEAKERALPEIVQLRNYIEKVWDAGKQVPTFGTVKIDEIKTAFYNSLYASTESALKNLTELSDKIQKIPA